MPMSLSSVAAECHPSKLFFVIFGFIITTSDVKDI